MSAMSELPLVPNGALWDLMRRLPAGMEVPRLGAKVGRALDDVEAYKDLYSLSLQRLQCASSSLSKKTLKQQRRGRAVAATTQDVPRDESVTEIGTGLSIPWRQIAVAL